MRLFSRLVTVPTEINHQEVKQLTDALVKDSKRFEKEEVGLQEKKKHLSTKQKKFKKSITDVRVLLTILNLDS